MFFFFENTSKKFKLNLVLVLTLKALYYKKCISNVDYCFYKLQKYD